MKSENYIFIGDIHGCRDTLKALLSKLDPYSNRCLIFAGDYIDRGPHSKGVLDLLMGLGKKWRCIFLRGNHEQMLLNALDYEETTFWSKNGGRQTLESFQATHPAGIPALYIRFIRKARFFFETPEYLFVHAGLHPHKTIQNQLKRKDIEHIALWSRDHMQVPVVWEKTVIFGHTPVSEPLVEHRKVGIDTGCVYSGEGLARLTALLLPEKTFVHQPCLDTIK